MFCFFFSSVLNAAEKQKPYNIFEFSREAFQRKKTFEFLLICTAFHQNFISS